MPDHRIRFRGAWDWHGPEGEADAEVQVARRVTLPADWPDGLDRPFRLLRRFGRPPFNPATEGARLELAGVPGLIAARLNGRSLGEIPAGVVDWTIPLSDDLLPRNALVLEVALPPGPEGRRAWGSIALIVAGKG